MLNAQWEMKYDPSVLKFETALNTNEAGTGINLMPYAPDAVWNVIPEQNVIYGNCTSTNLYRIGGKRAPFVTVNLQSYRYRRDNC